MDNHVHPEAPNADVLGGLARQKLAFEMIDLVERFRERQALIAKQVESRDRALTNFCIRVDRSLVMLGTLAGFIGQHSIDPKMKHVAQLLTSELEYMESSLKDVLHICIDTLDEGAGQ